MPKVYGSPTGYQAPDVNRKQRAASPATDAQVHSAYQAHMRAAHEQFLKTQKSATPRSRGNSTTAPSTRGSVPGIDAAIAKSGG
jgi:hypothetical protein